MEKIPSFQQALASTRILRPPQHHLSTFGTTTLRYVLLSVPSEPEGVCRVREGDVTAERPRIMTPELLKERFSGFGEESHAYQEQMEHHYGHAFRALEYRFKNDLHSTSTEHASLIEIRDRVLKTMTVDNAPRTVVLQGVDRYWSLCLMKFILDLTLQSFPGNIREIDERGLFDPEGRRLNLQRHQIEKLFLSAQKDRSQTKILGEYLQTSGLFREYEDRFFSLIR